MNVFKTKDGSKQILTVDNYENATGKTLPYIQNDKNKVSYFALCPSCNNPIQIINLYTNSVIEKKTGRKGLYAKHYIKNVKGLTDYDEKAYKNCPLHNLICLGTYTIKHDTEKSKEMLELINNNMSKIKDDIRNILGTQNFKKVDELINNFIKNEYYCCQFTNEYNIPYSILYTSEAISIFGQTLDNSDLGKDIKENIELNSKYFHINSNNQIEKNPEEKDYVEIRIMFTKHIVKKGLIELKVYEKKNKIDYLMTKTITMNEYIYI